MSGSRCTLALVALLTPGCRQVLGIEPAALLDAPPDAPLLCLSDRFDRIDPTRWVVYQTSPVVVDAVAGVGLRIQLATDNAYGGLTSRSTFDFTREAEAAEVELVQASSGTTEAGLELDADATHRVILSVSVGELWATIDNGGVKDQVTAPYDPAANRHLRIRRARDALVFETSPDGMAWIMLLERLPTFAVDALTMDPYAGTFAATANPGTAIFANFTVTCPSL